MWSFVASELKRTELNKVNVSCSLLFSFRLCVFTLNLSAEHPTGMSDASLLVPQAELPPSFIFMP